MLEYYLFSVYTKAEEVGHASCHVISLAHARSLDSATFIHQDSLHYWQRLYSGVLKIDTE